MCGRYSPPDQAEIERFWQIGRVNWRSPFESVHQVRYNVAPQQGNPRNYVPVIRADRDGTLELCDMQWWLLPFWSKESRTKYSTFNARIENVATSHSFSVPFTRQRCLIPAKGWYEWQQLNLVKQPWYFHFASGEPAAFAGIWDFWERDGEIIESCAIIVGEPNRTVSAIHDRMPLFVTKENEADWLSPALTNPEMIRLLLQTAPDETVRFHKVSARVNNASVDSPDLVEALTE